MAVNFNAGSTGVNGLQTLNLHNDKMIIKNDNNFVLSGIEHTDEDMQIEIVDDTEFTVADENPAEDIKPKVIGEPREVTVGVTEAQQETIDNMVDGLMQKYGAKDVLDNVLYKDEDGNPKSQVITHKNEDGTYSKTVISYDKNGKISKAAVVKCSDENCENILDGYYENYKYNDDGTVEVQPHSGWAAENGAQLEIMVYHIPIIINPDGTTKISFQPLGSSLKLL